jgi:hypothetical protein
MDPDEAAEKMENKPDAKPEKKAKKAKTSEE